MVITGEAEKEYWNLLRGNQGKHREFKNKQGRYVTGFNDAVNLTLAIVYTFLLCCWIWTHEKGNLFVEERTVAARNGVVSGRSCCRFRCLCFAVLCFIFFGLGVK